MNALFVTALTLAAATAAAADRSFDRTLTVSAAPELSVSTGSGNVHLHPGSDFQVHIAAHLRANDHGIFGGSSDVEARMQRIANNPPINQAGSFITIGERHQDDLYRNISIDYDITVPRAAAITANSGSGNIVVEDVGASLKAETGSGNVSARGIHGAADLHTGSGDIDLREAASGDVRAHSGSGNVRVDAMAGGLRADTGSGDITVTGKPATDWRLQTGSGNIRLDVGSSARFTLEATTGYGSVHVDQPITMQGALDKHRVSGTVNGGGPTLRAGTGSGDIQIR